MSSTSHVARIPMLIGGDWREGRSHVATVDPYRGETVSMAPESTAQDVADAVAAARRAAPAVAAMPPYERAKMLRRIAARLAAHVDELSELMARETGKAIGDCRVEVSRAPGVFELSAEEAIRIEGEHVPLGASPMGDGRMCFLMRFPVGVVAGITPFNAPLNLAAHKIAPALAAGNAVVLKVPPQSPTVVSRLFEVIRDCDVPPGYVNSLYGSAAGPLLVQSDVDFISFTGSSRAGAAIRASAGLRRVALELGGTGSTIVHADAELETAAKLCARNAHRLAGQSCISVQNVYVHRSVAARFTEQLLAEVGRMKVGDPLDPATDVGTLIDEAAARRVSDWIDEAVASGARRLCGGERRGAQLTPTVLTDVDPRTKVVCEEVFGPLENIIPFDNVSDVYRRLNESPYGLQTGVFTASAALAMEAFRTIRTGGVIHNATSTWRTDQMPYGGVKSSGIGREGPRYAIRDMTDERLIVL
jgi:acyl-CoA reductase-like NAD-dependent aldehyde dehydrogenase